MKTKYQFYSDPGHGWLKVPLKELYQLEIAEDISSYSYRRKEFVYLEEDDDLSTFIGARFGNITGEDFSKHINYHSSNKRSKIRSYSLYEAQSKQDYEKSKQIQNVILKAKNWTKNAKVTIQSSGFDYLQEIADGNGISLKGVI